MSTFKPKRTSGADLVRQISAVTADLPSQSGHPGDRGVVEKGIHRSQPAERERPPPVVQVNFKVSERLAALIAEQGEKAGSTRRFFARVLRDAGFEVPDADISPPDTRRRWSKS